MYYLIIRPNCWNMLKTIVYLSTGQTFNIVKNIYIKKSKKKQITYLCSIICLFVCLFYFLLRLILIANNINVSVQS